MFGTKPSITHALAGITASIDELNQVAEANAIAAEEKNLLIQSLHIEADALAADAERCNRIALRYEEFIE